MGWTFYCEFTKRHDCKAFIEKMLQRQENDYGIWEHIHHCRRGNVVWTVAQVTNKKASEVKKFIMCYLIQFDKSWGYKDMGESMEPYYYSCPLKYLEIADPPEDKHSTKWREDVRQHWAKKKIQSNNANRVKKELLLLATRDNLANGRVRLHLRNCTIPYLDIWYVSPKIVGCYGSKMYSKVNPKFMDRVEFIPSLVRTEVVGVS